MRITFQIPELFVVFSFVFLLKGLYWGGGIIMGVGLFLAVARFSLEMQRKKEEDQQKLEMITQVSESFISLLSGYKKDNKYH
tara:strand:- start:372 stop:617 length:246 start_codon:yes stop_codon:yes gene_type:complete